MSRVLAAFCVALIISGCRVSPAERWSESITDSVPLDPGFKVFPTPRTFDGPATVFRIASSTRFPVRDLHIGVTTVGEEALAGENTTNSWKASGLATFLSKPLTTKGVELSGEAGSDVTSVIVFNQGIRERITDDTELKNAIKQANIVYERSSHYFVIYETIAVPQMNVVLDRSGQFSLKVAATAQKAIDGNGSLSWSNSNKLTISEKFDKPFHVFYTCEEIIPPGNGLSNNGEPTLIKLDPRDQPIWNSEKSTPQ